MVSEITTAIIISSQFMTKHMEKKQTAVWFWGGFFLINLYHQEIIFHSIVQQISPFSKIGKKCKLHTRWLINSWLFPNIATYLPLFFTRSILTKKSFRAEYLSFKRFKLILKILKFLYCVVNAEHLYFKEMIKVCLLYPDLAMVHIFF